MGSKSFKHYLPYILGGLFGLIFRTAVCAAKGVSYTIDGHDLLNAALIICFVWCVYKLLGAGNKK